MSDHGWIERHNRRARCPAGAGYGVAVTVDAQRSLVAVDPVPSTSDRSPGAAAGGGAEDDTSPTPTGAVLSDRSPPAAPGPLSPGWKDVGPDERVAAAWKRSVA